MAANKPGEIIQPGPLVESMQSGLMRMLGWQQTFAALEGYQQAVRGRLTEPDELQGSLEALHGILLSEPGQPELSIFTFFNERPNWNATRIVGEVTFLLSARDEVIEGERQAWVDDPAVQEWLGEPVILRRPPASVTRKDDDWGSQGPLYRGVESDQPIDRYYRGGDRADFEGRLQDVSLAQDGRVMLNRGQGGTEVIEMFEAVKDPETDVITRYVPRVSIETVSRSDRMKRALRQAAISRLAPDLPELS